MESFPHPLGRLPFEETRQQLGYAGSSAEWSSISNESEVPRESHLGILQFVMPALLCEGALVLYALWVQHRIEVHIHQVVEILQGQYNIMCTLIQDYLVPTCNGTWGSRLGNAEAKFLF